MRTFALVAAILVAAMWSPGGAHAGDACLATGVAGVGDGFPIAAAPEGGEVRYVAAAWNPDRAEYFVAWVTYDGGFGVHGQRIAMDGTSIGPVIGIAESPNAFIDPAVAAAPGHDRYLVAWRTQDSPFNGARGSVIAGDGNGIAGNVVLSTAGNEPSLAFANGRFVLTARAAGIYARAIDLDGTPIGELLEVTDASGGPGPNGGLAANAAGQVLSLWRNQDQGRLDGRRISAAGTVSGPVTTYANEEPGSGRAAFVTYRASADDYLVLYARADDPAVRWLAVDAAGAGSTPQTVVEANGRAIGMAWDEATAGTLLLWSEFGGDPPARSYFGQLLAADGELVGAPTPLPGVSGSRHSLAGAPAFGEALLVSVSGGDLVGQRLAYGCTLRDPIFADGFD